MHHLGRKKLLANSLYFFSKTDVIYSAIGTILWTIVLATWIALFQINRVEWGEFADEISFIIPLGSK